MILYHVKFLLGESFSFGRIVVVFMIEIYLLDHNKSA